MADGAVVLIAAPFDPFADPGAVVGGTRRLSDGQREMLVTGQMLMCMPRAAGGTTGIDRDEARRMAVPAVMQPLSQCRQNAEPSQHQQREERLAEQSKHEDAQIRMSRRLPPAGGIAVRPGVIVPKCNQLSRAFVHQQHFLGRHGVVPLNRLRRRSWTVPAQTRSVPKAFRPALSASATWENPAERATVRDAPASGFRCMRVGYGQRFRKP